MVDALVQTARFRSRPARRLPWAAIWRLLLGSKLNIAITLAIGVALVAWGLPLLRWATVDATFFGSAATCAAQPAGACWAFIGEKLPYILFGAYPHDQLWRPTVGLIGIFLLLVATAVPRLWSSKLILVWILGLTCVVALLHGGGLTMGLLREVPTQDWGGLPVTMLLTVIGFLGAFPLAIVLALARRSGFGGFRTLAIGYIELVRGVPFIALLYAATLLFPLMLPAGAEIDKFARATVALILFVAAYLAEIIRAGLQSLPPGQGEAARSLGLSYWHTIRLVVLPQALKAVIAPLVTLAIGIFLDTTLVIIIGMFDFLNTARTAATDPNWLGFYAEAYAFAAATYLVLATIAARYSLWLERRLDT